MSSPALTPAEGHPFPAEPLTATGAMRAIEKLPKFDNSPAAVEHLREILVEKQGWPAAPPESRYATVGDAAEAAVAAERIRVKVGPLPVRRPLASLPPAVQSFRAFPDPAPAHVPTPDEELARLRLADIVYAAGRHAEPALGIYCPDCRAAAAWCDACMHARVTAEKLYALHDLILAADTYAAAALLVANADLSGEVR